VADVAGIAVGGVDALGPLNHRAEVGPQHSQFPDALDPFDNGETGSLACRIYWRDQSLGGTPSAPQLVEALNR
jgi:hypothetical protein